MLSRARQTLYPTNARAPWVASQACLIFSAFGFLMPSHCVRYCTADRLFSLDSISVPHLSTMRCRQEEREVATGSQAVCVCVWAGARAPQAGQLGSVVQLGSA